MRKRFATNASRVVAWGDLDYDLAIVPSRPASGSVAGISAGDFHSLLLRGDGTLTAWGDDRFGQTSIPGPAQQGSVVEAVAGNVHNLALLRDGTVIAWGPPAGEPGDYGQCDVPDGLNGVVAVAAGAVHSLALRGDGTVAAWGSDAFGQCDVPPELPRRGDCGWNVAQPGPPGGRHGGRVGRR